LATGSLQWLLKQGLRSCSAPRICARGLLQKLCDGQEGLPAKPKSWSTKGFGKFGILDRLTKLGIEQRHPEQADARKLMGKFYFRPPAGESWCDVILRLRSMVDTISLHHTGKRVLIVAHQVVVLCLRYLLENMDEDKILRIDAEGDVANCAVTEYSLQDRQEGSALVLQKYNFVAPLESKGAPVTSQPDANVAAR
jgi:2,3-bisphosphoglycerate-dependent phosphoglycerate mutase